MKAPRSGRVLDANDASIIRSMIGRGDRQHDIASYFGVNGGRIGEISSEETFPGVLPSTGNLPPAAPYLVVSADFRPEMKKLYSELLKVGIAQQTLASLDALIAAFDASHRARDGV